MKMDHVNYLINFLKKDLIMIIHVIQNGQHSKKRKKMCDNSKKKEENVRQFKH